jgi:hypothetical protein
MWVLGVVLRLFGFLAVLGFGLEQVRRLAKV